MATLVQTEQGESGMMGGGGGRGERERERGPKISNTSLTWVNKPRFPSQLCIAVSSVCELFDNIKSKTSSPRLWARN